MIITIITPSINLKKKYDAELADGTVISFGSKNSISYIDHQDKNKRFNYWKRINADKNKLEKIKNLVPSSILFTSMLLYHTDDLDKNVEILNCLFKIKKLKS